VGQRAVAEGAYGLPDRVVLVVGGALVDRHLGVTRRPRAVKATMMANETVVLPTSLCVPAISSRGACMILYKPIRTPPYTDLIGVPK
jgi:hypothetical protein